MKKMIGFNFFLSISMSILLTGCGPGLSLFDTPRGTSSKSSSSIESSSSNSNNKTSSPPVATTPTAPSSSSPSPISPSVPVAPPIVANHEVLQETTTEISQTPVLEEGVEVLVSENPSIQSTEEIVGPEVLAEVQPPVFEKSLLFINVLSGKCLTVENDSKKPGSRGLQWDCNGERNQKFDLIKVGTNRFKIFSPYSRNFLTILDDIYTEGAETVMSPNLDVSNQVFSKIRINSSGAFMLKAEHSGQCLSIEGGLWDNGARVIQWPCQDLMNQIFLEEKPENFASFVIR